MSLEMSYVETLGFALPRFKKVNSHLFRFPCQNCGDWSDSKRKYSCVGYVVDEGEAPYFYCHRCGNHKSAISLIKEMDQALYNELIFEKYKKNKPEKKKIEDVNLKREVKDKSLLEDLSNIFHLPNNHPASRYIREKRKIPVKYWNDIFYCENFMEWTNKIVPNSFSKDALKFDEPRLIIPFFTKEGKIHAYVARSFKKNSTSKYILTTINEEIPSIFGLDKVDFKKDVVVLEGPIDSMFVSNSLATNGGDMVSKLSSLDKNRLIICMDNEPRSSSMKNKMEKAIREGYKIVIWPQTISCKDINQMILSGMKKEEIEEIIYDNIYFGMAAKLKLNEWSKI